MDVPLQIWALKGFPYRYFGFYVLATEILGILSGPCLGVLENQGPHIDRTALEVRTSAKRAPNLQNSHIRLPE